MKSTNKIKSFIIMMITCSAILISCKKSDPNPSATNLDPGKSQISCTVAGAVSSSFSTSTLVSTAIKNASLMNISGSNTSLPIQLMLFIIPTNITVGSHNLSTDDEFTVSYTNDTKGWAAGNVGDNFTLVVTKNDGTLFEGTFSGTLTNDDGTSVTITNGKIAAKF